MENFYSLPKDLIIKNEIVINKSRFLGYAKYISNQIEAEDFIKEIRIQHKDSRHICFAYRLHNLCKMSDDGEPSGTAGKPILQVLEMKKLFNICLIVVRYFGGVKLGAGGLLRAYSNTATDCCNNSRIVEYQDSVLFEYECSLSEYQNFLRFVEGNDIIIINTIFGLKVNIKGIANKNIQLPKLCKVLCSTMQYFDK